MTEKLCILCCQNFYPEVAEAVRAEGWADVAVAAFPARCGHPPLGWAEIEPLLEAGCDKVVIIGHACLKDLAGPPDVQVELLDACFDLLAGSTLIDEAIAKDVYLVTPGWLENWRGNLGRMGFDEENSQGFFRDFARELLLLDTGVSADAQDKLAEFSRAAGLPATRIAVGIDCVRLRLARVVAEWRLFCERQRAASCRLDHARELADHKSAMDFLGRLPALKDERETISSIEEMFHMLFAPGQFYYVRFDQDGAAHCDEALPAELSGQIGALNSDWAYTDSKTGFLLRIFRAEQTLGVIVADRFAFPQYCNHYLNLALSVAGVAGLAIDNARTYRLIKETEAALRKSERSLEMAQAMAHLGHWELIFGTDDISWSDETYRILGYDPQKQAPSYSAFIQAIHRDDRARVEKHIQGAHEGDGFDIEFRVVLPDGRVRVLHGMGEMIRTCGDARIIGAIQDTTGHEGPELLGVIQDITEHKELEWKLEQEAHTDPLTGCANRRYFKELAAHELARARRYSEDLSVLMLDLDHFKAVNDQFGHQVGDLVLQKLVHVCQITLRAADVIGRLGGEEFAVLLPETGRGKAVEIAERLCQAVAEAEVPLPDRAPIRFTTSIGVTTLTQEDAGMDAAIGRADQALYRAKDAGRNRVVAA